MKKQEVVAKSATVIPTPEFSLFTPIKSIKCWYSEKIGTTDKLFVINFNAWSSYKFEIAADQKS